MKPVTSGQGIIKAIRHRFPFRRVPSWCHLRQRQSPRYPAVALSTGRWDWPARRPRGKDTSKDDIAEGPYGAQDAPIVFSQHGGRDIARDFLAAAIDEVDRLIDRLDTGFQGSLHQTPGCSDIRLKRLVTAPPDGLFRRHAGDLLGRRVETGDNPIAVQGENTLGDGA